ncbi:hypothetical protein FHS33_005066 [Streptomyces calvus]|uniref:Uncharacterized protein n=1 Tax=Streptomyces calvus TaxID=67282 RepID=A0AA40SHZ0_9ACTN|nr:hypothetical protein [Streptomyces calvus]MBA8974360.1 hypothetical protein [Streptomyces calvus]
MASQAVTSFTARGIVSGTRPLLTVTTFGRSHADRFIRRTGAASRSAPECPRRALGAASVRPRCGLGASGRGGGVNVRVCRGCTTAGGSAVRRRAALGTGAGGSGGRRGVDAVEKEVRLLRREFGYPSPAHGSRRYGSVSRTDRRGSDGPAEESDGPAEESVRPAEESGRPAEESGRPAEESDGPVESHADQPGSDGPAASRTDRPRVRFSSRPASRAAVRGSCRERRPARPAVEPRLPLCRPAGRCHRGCLCVAPRNGVTAAGRQAGRGPEVRARVSGPAATGCPAGRVRPPVPSAGGGRPSPCR